MRFIAASFLTLLAASAVPASAQQLSPMTGTTAAPPTSAPVPAPATAPNPTAAPAGTPGHHRMTPKQRFEASNTTHDGKLTHDQATAGHMVRVSHNFDAIDADHKGYVTMADIQGYNRAQRAARKAAKQ